MLNDIQFKARYINTTKNSIADALSRFQTHRFRLLAPQAEKQPAPVPTNFGKSFSTCNKEIGWEFNSNKYTANISERDFSFLSI
jgi:hypothetical protein